MQKDETETVISPIGPLKIKDTNCTRPRSPHSLNMQNKKIESHRYIYMNGDAAEFKLTFTYPRRLWGRLIGAFHSLQKVTGCSDSY